MSAARRLDIDLNACIGCQACTNVCPAALIGFKDEKTERVFKFAATCSEDCSRCAEACSENAITLSPKNIAPKKPLTARFPLARCTGCGSAFVTVKMLDKLKATIPALLVPQDMDWLSACPDCRQKHEAENISIQ